MLFGVWWINRRGEGERRVRQEAHVPFDNGPRSGIVNSDVAGDAYGKFCRGEKPCRS